MQHTGSEVVAQRPSGGLPDGLLLFCRPFHEAGPLVNPVRTRLQGRAEGLVWQKVEEIFAGPHLIANGRTIRLDVKGLTACFFVPVDTCDARLFSESSAPAHVTPGSTDDRQLGVPLAALTINDGLAGDRAIALDDTRLGQGFHAGEGSTRWTDGVAVVPAHPCGRAERAHSS
jgi:hypothetical protein